MISALTETPRGYPRQMPESSAPPLRPPHTATGTDARRLRLTRPLRSLVLWQVASQTRREEARDARRTPVRRASLATERRSMATQIGAAPGLAVRRGVRYHRLISARERTEQETCHAALHQGRRRADGSQQRGREPRGNRRADA